MADILQIMMGGRIRVEIGGVEEVELVKLLGVGGFGAAWKVADTATGDFYTLKIIQGLEPGGVMADRVRMEAEVDIPSEHVVRVVGLREWDPSTFLILFEYFDASSLHALLVGGRLDDGQRRDIFRQTLLGVADAHLANVVHRDLKPENVLVGKGGRVKLIDFGVSKFKARKVTVDGQIFGTYRYMAPEFYLHPSGSKIADARADIYALGHILYELAMGQHFWARRGWRELKDFIRYIRQEPRPSEAIDLSDFNCDFYPRAADALPQMVKLNPEERFASVESVLEMLDETVYEPAPMPSDLSFPLLLVETGTNSGARTVLSIPDGGTLVLGRTDIAGNDPSISRAHLEFSRRGGRYFVRDVGSKNGTFLRGLRLPPRAEPVEVREADRIRTGDVFLRLVNLRDGYTVEEGSSEHESLPEVRGVEHRRRQVL